MRIGITGGIGSGKTFICDILKEKGYPVYNCDDEAKRLMTENKDIINGLKTLVGEEAYTIDGALNKPVIAKFLFANAENGKKINSIVHPVVKEDFLRWAEEKEREGRTAIMECAILFESHFDNVVDHTILIWAKDSTRLKRAMTRDHASKESISARMKAQIPSEEAIKKADFIFNHESYDETEAEMQRLIDFIGS